VKTQKYPGNGADFSQRFLWPIDAVLSIQSAKAAASAEVPPEPMPMRRVERSTGHHRTSDCISCCLVATISMASNLRRVVLNRQSLARSNRGTKQMPLVFFELAVRIFE